MEKPVLIISDLHLSEANPKTAALFEQFIQQHAIQAKALYILGDFFEYWVGDDTITPFHQHIINLLKQLHQHGVTLYFMHGNRDFLVGKRFLAACHATYLGDPTVIQPFGTRILLAHGDAFCTDQKGYQCFRWLTRRHIVKRLFLLLPKSWRHQFAKKLRNKSQQQYQRYQQTPTYGDVNNNSVLKALDRNQCPILIHGHTHRQATHKLGDNKQRWVLSDWHDDYASYISLTSASGIQQHPYTGQ